jgi:hypothetical protein
MASADKGIQTDMIIMDFEKAFDKVPHKKLLNKLMRVGIRGNLHKWVNCFLTKRQQRVIVNGEKSDWVDVTSGVPQGTVTGPLWFLIFINDLPLNITSNIRLFADDCVLYRCIKSPSDAELLQKDLDTLTQWQNRWQMRFNEKKCFIMRITQSKKPLQYNYKLNNSTLQETSSHSYLGVEISQDLKWNQHINNIAAKANRTLGFVRRNLKSCSRHIKTVAYKTLIRPILEYSASIWDPYTQLLINKLEAVQRRAVRFIMNDYDYFHSVSDMMIKLEIPLLSLRRTINRLTNFHKAREGTLAIPLQTLLHPVRRLTRYCHKNSYIPIQTTKNFYHQSFIPQTTRDWNQLPEALTHLTDSNKFKQEITTHYLTK